MVVANHMRRMPKPRSALAGLRLLLTDDDVAWPQAFAFALRKAGAEVVLAADARSTICAFGEAVASGRPFAAVVTDLELPDAPGTDIARRLRAMGFTGPILVATAHEPSAVAERCREAGADAVLEKTGSLVEQFRRIATAVEARMLGTVDAT